MLAFAFALVAAFAPGLAGEAVAATIPAPTAATSGVSGVSYSAATLHGNVNAKGQATNYYFEYGTTSAYGAQSPLSPAGAATSTVKVAQAIAGLQAATKYHYRLVAVGPGGTVAGGERTFTTKRIPLSLALVSTPNPVVFGSPFYVEGTLSGTGGANHAIVLQANPFPYTGGFKTVGNAELTNATGGFSFPYLGLRENAQLRVVTVGLPVVVSPVVLEGVAVKARVHVHSTRRRGYVRMYGTVTPAEPGAQVGFQLLKPGHASVNQGGTPVKAATAGYSRFSGFMRLRHRGLYRVLIKVTNDGAHVSNRSAPILIR
ncbi:MAG: hypothetical protein ACRDK7_05270 [Solirubrobacteraceae bacterium]